MTIEQLSAARRTTTANDITNEQLFQEFSKNFSSTDLNFIRSVGPGPRNDFKFINKITKALYKNEESKLFSRSAAGRKHKGESKSEISIEKKELMKSMLNERLGHELSNDSVLEFAKRTKNFNALLRSAIHNIKYGLKKDQVCNFTIIEIIFQNMALYFVYFFVL